MSFNNLTVSQKRLALRKYYETKYQKLISREYDDYFTDLKKGNSHPREQFKTRIRFLSRERNNYLARVDTAKKSEINKLYAEVLGNRK